MKKKITLVYLILSHIFFGMFLNSLSSKNNLSQNNVPEFKPTITPLFPKIPRKNFHYSNNQTSSYQDFVINQIFKFHNLFLSYNLNYKDINLEINDSHIAFIKTFPSKILSDILNNKMIVFYDNLSQSTNKSTSLEIYQPTFTTNLSCIDYYQNSSALLKKTNNWEISRNSTEKGRLKIKLLHHSNNLKKVFNSTDFNFDNRNELAFNDNFQTTHDSIILTPNPIKQKSGNSSLLTFSVLLLMPYTTYYLTIIIDKTVSLFNLLNNNNNNNNNEQKQEDFFDAEKEIFFDAREDFFDDDSDDSKNSPTFSFSISSN
jgi:hypothetical protein